MIQYLSPFVLRKELETIMRTEGDRVLLALDLADSHSAIYWNMLYYFTRAQMPTYLAGLLFHSRILTNAAATSSATCSDSDAISIQTIDTLDPDAIANALRHVVALASRVSITPLWENIHIDHATNDLPLYYYWVYF